MKTKSTLSFPLVKLTDDSLIKLACVKKIIAHANSKHKLGPPTWDEFVNMYDCPVENLLQVSINLDVIDRLEEQMHAYQERCK